MLIHRRRRCINNKRTLGQNIRVTIYAPISMFADVSYCGGVIKNKITKYTICKPATLSYSTTLQSYPPPTSGHSERLGPKNVRNICLLKCPLLCGGHSAPTPHTHTKWTLLTINTLKSPPIRYRRILADFGCSVNDLWRGGCLPIQ